MESTTQLIESDSGDVELPYVLTADVPGLAPVAIRNLTERHVDVHLSSSLREQITFQRSNANLLHDDISQLDQELDDPSDWNELFNEVDRLRVLKLNPREQTTVVVCFRPTELSGAAGSTSAQAAQASELQLQEVEDDAVFRAPRHYHSTSRVKATLYFDARMQSSDAPDAECPADHASRLHANAATDAHANASTDARTDAWAETHADARADARAEAARAGADEAAAAADEAAAAADEAAAAQRLCVDFSARLCQAVLKTDVQELVFDDCLVGRSAVKDFTVWNCSEVPIRFRLNVVRRPRRAGELDFTKLDSGMPVSEAGETVNGFSHERIRVAFVPRQPGRHLMEIELASLTDARNCQTIRIHAHASVEPLAEGLSLSGGGTLDFGDCYATVPKRQLLVVKNVSGDALDVHFSTELTDEVSFDLHTEYDSDAAARAKATSEALTADRSSELSEEAAMLASSERAAIAERADGSASAPSIDRMRRIEELSIEPGRERAVYVWYVPRALDGTSACRLARRNFSIELRVHSPKRQREWHAQCVSCRARVCASTVSVSPSLINLGDCDIQTLKSAAAVIKNLSDLPATLTVSVQSKVLSTAESHITVAPRTSHELKLHFTPRRVNPDYRKQVTISNLNNANDEHVLEIVANNVDRHNVSFHSLFYNLALLRSAPTDARMSGAVPAASVAAAASAGPLGELSKVSPDKCRIAFDDVVARSMHVRALSVRNISKKPLLLKLECWVPHGGTLCLYRQGDGTGSEHSAKGSLDGGQETPASGRDKLEQLLQRFEAQAPLGIGSSITLEDSDVRSVTPCWKSVDREPRLESVRRMLPKEDLTLNPRIARTASADDEQRDSRSRMSTATNAHAQPSSCDVGAAAAMRSSVTADFSVLSRRGSSSHPSAGRLTSEQMVAVASAFRDLHTSHRQAVRAAAVLEASSGGSSRTGGLDAVLDAWRSAPDAGAMAAPSPHEVEAALVTLHTWLRTTMEYWKRNEQIVPLSASGGLLLLDEGEERVLLVECVPEMPPHGEVVDGAERQSPRDTGGAVANIAPTADATSEVIATTAAPVTACTDGAATSSHALSSAVVAADGPATAESAVAPAASEAAAATAAQADTAALQTLATTASSTTASVPATAAPANLASDVDSRPALLRTPEREGQKLMFEGHMSVRLVEYDEGLKEYHERRLRRFFPNETPQSPQTTRLLPVLITACRSAMEIAQRSINFGACEAQQLSVKSILLCNPSPAPLLYKVAKTGRHASFDLQICAEDRQGCVRPFGSRMIRFHFRPSLAGDFRETLTVQNVQDRSDELEVVVKAKVHKSVAFHVTAPSLDFGVCAPRSAAAVFHRLVISNVARGARRFNIDCERTLRFSDGRAAPYAAQASFRLEHATVDGAEALLQHERQREELLDLYTRKLRIAERKGRLDKVAKVKKKLAKLHAGGADVEPVQSDMDSDFSDWGGNSEAEGEDGFSCSRATTSRQGRAERDGVVDSLSFRLGRNGTQTVCVSLTLVLAAEPKLDDERAVASPPRRVADEPSKGLSLSSAASVALNAALQTASVDSGGLAELVLSGVLVVSESRDSESKQRLPFTVTVRLPSLPSVNQGAASVGELADTIDAIAFVGKREKPQLGSASPVPTDPRLSIATVAEAARRGHSPERSPTGSGEGDAAAQLARAPWRSSCASPRRRNSPVGMRSLAEALDEEAPAAVRPPVSRAAAESNKSAKKSVALPTAPATSNATEASDSKRTASAGDKPQKNLDAGSGAVALEMAAPAAAFTPREASHASQEKRVAVTEQACSTSRQAEARVDKPDRQESQRQAAESAVPFLGSAAAERGTERSATVGPCSPASTPPQLARSRTPHVTVTGASTAIERLTALSNAFRLDADFLSAQEAKESGVAPPLPTSAPPQGGRPIGTLLLEEAADAHLTLTSQCECALLIRLEWSLAPPAGVPQLSRPLIEDSPKVVLRALSSREGTARLPAPSAARAHQASIEVLLPPRDSVRVALHVVSSANERRGSPSVSSFPPLGYVTASPILASAALPAAAAAAVPDAVASANETLAATANPSPTSAPTSSASAAATSTTTSATNGTTTTSSSATAVAGHNITASAVPCSPSQVSAARNPSSGPTIPQLLLPCTIQLQRRPPAQTQSILRLDPAELDFGEVCSGSECASSRLPSLTFNIVNTGPIDINFVVMLRKDEQNAPQAPAAAADASSGGAARKGQGQLAVLNLHPHHGVVGAKAACAVEVRCIAPVPGRQKYTVVVRNLSTSQDHTLSVRLRGVHPQRLAFPDLPPGDDPKLSLGLCYIHQPRADSIASPVALAAPSTNGSSSTGAANGAVNGGSNGVCNGGNGHGLQRSRRFMRQVPLRITNLQAADRRLTVSSNLLKQILIFGDADCKTPAVDLPLPALQTATLWVSLQPHLSADVLCGDACRQLVGGIRVVLTDHDGNVDDEQTIELDATFGRSLLRVSTTSVQLGCTLAPRQPAAAALTIGNVSDSMPLEWRAEAPPGLSVFPRSGIVSAKQGGPVQQVRVQVRQDCPFDGYYRRDVRIVDVNAPHEDVRVRVEAMLDNGRVQTALPRDALGMPHLDAGTLHAVRPHGVRPSSTGSAARSPHQWTESPPSCESPVSSHLLSQESDADRLERAERASCSSASTISTNDLYTFDAERISSSVARENNHHLCSASPSSSVNESSEAGTIAAEPAASSRSLRGDLALDVLPGSAFTDGSHCSFRVRNASTEPLSLQPVSDLPLTTLLCGHDGHALVNGTATHEHTHERSHAYERPRDRGAALDDRSHPMSSNGGVGTACLDGADRHGHASRRSRRDAPELAPCGTPFVLLPRAEVELRIQLHAMPRLIAEKEPGATSDTVMDAEKRVLLQLGGLLYWEGLLLLEELSPPRTPENYPNVPTAPALKAVRLHGSICVSLVSLPRPLVSLGKVGYVDGWRDVPFQFELRNESAVATLCRVVDLPEVIRLPDATRASGGALEIRLTEGQSTHVSGVLCTSALSAPQTAEEGSWVIRLFNVHNPTNLLKVHVMAEVTVLRLRYNRLCWPRYGWMMSDPRNSAGVQVPASIDASAEESSFTSAAGPLSIEGLEEAEGAISNAASMAEGDIYMPRPHPSMDHELDLMELDEVIRSVQRDNGDACDGGAAAGAAVHAALVLPPLLQPPLPSTPPCSAWFELHNCSRETMPLQLSVVETAENVRTLGHIALELLLRASHTPVSSLTLAPGEHVELMLRADLPNSAFVPAQEMLRRPLVLGALRLSTARASAATAIDAVNDTIALVGSLTRGPSFSLNVTHLNFNGVPVMPLKRAPEFGSTPPAAVARVPQNESFYIRNLSKEREIEVQVAVDVPGHIASVHVAPSQVFVPADQSVHINVQVLPFLSRYSGDDATLRVRELSAPDCETCVQLALVEKVASFSPKEAVAPSPLASAIRMSNGEPSCFSLDGDGEAAARLALRGVASVRGSSRRYEVNLGQQNFGTEGVQWELRVENLSARPVRYRLFTMSTEEGEEWLSFSRTSGTLQEQHETQVVTLHCATDKLEIYPTYVVVENLDNTDDLKTVLISMEMVVSRVTASNYYSVIVDGKAPQAVATPEGRAAATRDSDLSLDLGDVYYGVLYVNRSFVVENHSSMPLHFMISHNLRRSACTELNFSLSNLSLKLFSSLLVPPASSTRVYLHVRTSAPPGASAKLDEPEKLQVDVSVSCHLIKDSHKLIRLSATCRPPHLGLSHTDVEFCTPRLEVPSKGGQHPAGSSALPSPPLRIARLEPAQQVIAVSNLGGGALSYAVRSSCCFFIVRADNAEPSILSADEPAHTITVTPNDLAIQQHAAFISKARYVEEHFTVYNRGDLNEHKQVLVRLSCGQQQQQSFSYAPSKPIYSSSVLEEEILSFLCSFKSFWEAHLADLLSADLGGGVGQVSGGSSSSGLTGCCCAMLPSAEAAATAAAEPPPPSSSLSTALLDRCESIARNETYRELWFDFRHITDELVFYGMKAQTSHFVSPLANLCYKMLFRNDVFDVFNGSLSKHRRLFPPGTEPRSFPPPLLPWVKQLSYFLMHFPDVHSGIDPLRRLETSLLSRSIPASIPFQPEMLLCRSSSKMSQSSR